MKTIEEKREYFREYYRKKKEADPNYYYNNQKKSRAKNKIESKCIKGIIATRMLAETENNIKLTVKKWGSIKVGKIYRFVERQEENAIYYAIVIDKTKNHFTLKTKNNITKSFTFSDILTGVLQITMVGDEANVWIWVNLFRWK